MRTSLWEPRSFRPHSKDCTRVTKEQANVQKKKQKELDQTVQLLDETKTKYNKHKTAKNKHSMNEATRILRAAKDAMPDSDDSDVQVLAQMPNVHTASLKPKEAAKLVVHLYRIGKEPSPPDVRSALAHHVIGDLPGHYIQRVKDAAEILYKAREMQSLQMMPRCTPSLFTAHTYSTHSLYLQHTFSLFTATCVLTGT